MPDLISDFTKAALGLRRGEVVLMEHNRRWSLVYALTASEIAAVTGMSDDRIQHVGSTSVEGLAAKPILDIALGVDRADEIDPIAKNLTGVGYIDRGAGNDGIGRLMVRESAPNVRVFHVHIVQYETEAWRHYVDFRDALRNDSLMRDQYADAKRTLAERFPEDRKSYREAKNAFIRKTLDVLSSDGDGPASSTQSERR